jgi:hypothetical protein
LFKAAHRDYCAWEDIKSTKAPRQVRAPISCVRMAEKRKKSVKQDDFAPLPKKAVLVDEADFDKVIAQLLKSSPVGIYEIRLSGKRGSKKPPSQR